MTPAALSRLVPGAPQALCDMLAGPDAALEPPIRSEIFGLQRFARHGLSLGATHRAGRSRSASSSFFPRLRDNIAALRRAHRYIGVQAATGYDISPAAEWLLDNFHLIEAQLKEIHDGLPRGFFRALPLLIDEPLAGLPRVYGVAWAFVAHTDGAFDEDLLCSFLLAYQESRELRLCEMWALPTTLRVLLIENLRRLALRVATNKAAREVANLCCDRIESCTTAALDEVLAAMAQRGVDRVFLLQMAQRLQDRGTTLDEGYHGWLADALPDLAAAQAQQPLDQAADNLSVSNAVNALRAIGDADWPGIVARTSALMRLMLTSTAFASEHSATQDGTLHGIERLARATQLGEGAVARALLARMQSAPATEPAAAMPGHWLDGPGRAALLAALDRSESPALQLRAALRRNAVGLYLGLLAAASALLVAWLMRQHGTTAAWFALPGALLVLLPASEALVTILNRLISESTRPAHLPRLAFADGIALEHRVMVVIPVLLGSDAGTHAVVHRLRLHHLANPERYAQFALLSDWADADAAHAPADIAQLATARAAIESLNLLHPVAADEPPRFLLLHRARRFSTTEGSWIGWERKRGKLEQLVAALATGLPQGFADLGEISRIAPLTRHLVTLDSDTRLPPGQLRALVSVAAHPGNRPRLSADGRRVEAGFGILQPRVATPLPLRAQVTPFHWLFAGQGGVDPYAVASSEVYQDAFGEGSFSGKGLLDVRAMHAVLAGRLPEDSVLSHDLLEGALARCAAVSDITLIEDAPFHADVAASRVHRWTRGDWQLLPFLLQPRRYPMRAINRWKLFDNLRRSLVAPAALALLVAALAGQVLSPLAAIALVMTALSAGPLIGALAGCAPGRADVAWMHFARGAATDVVRALCGALWHLLQLLQQALLAVDAIVRALWRLLASRRHLLEWTTAAAAQAAAHATLPMMLRRHASLPAVALAVALALRALHAPWPLLAALLCGAWALTPLALWWISRPWPLERGAALRPGERAGLLGIARDTWGYFERCVGPDDLHLPPDNLQTQPQEMLARRTSPTNIGLYLLSAACARAFGWIDSADLARRLEATLGTLETLQRHRGHFLNWYDTQTGLPLTPMYVSTVDSGNLSGHLLAVAQACREFGTARTTTTTTATATATNDDAAATRQRLLDCAGRCEALAWAADFRFLYHRRRHLFHLGYRIVEQQLDAGFYDLLASESRLTSLLAIAKGDVPVSHWAALGRPFFAVGADAGLRSWSGSMFEYLMPTLVLEEPAGSVLDEACRATVNEQIAFAQALHVPWGISECAYAARDHTLAYQYSPQGVPRLALRRTPPDELVIAPYATALAAQVAPHRAVRNFAALDALDARTRMGFIESLDYSPARRSGPEAFVPVSTFMAHHQGMVIVALANVLLDGMPRRWGMAEPRIEAVASLLHERAPRAVSRLYEPPTGPPEQALQQRTPGLLREVTPGTTALAPTHVLSNGRYTASLRPNGAGWSRWGTIGLTRWRDDALRDACGSFFFLRWDRQPQPVSITQHPAPDPSAHYQSTFHADRVCFDAAWHGVRAHMTVWVSPEDDIEFRQVELRNLGERTLDIELISAFEVTLAEPRADEAHPAFSSLFVRARWQAGHQALVFERRPRGEGEPAVHLAHFLAENDAQVTALGVQADRALWAGRNRAASQPQAQLAPPPPGDAELPTGLDPMCALSARLRVAPGATARLTFATAAAGSADTLHAVIDKYLQANHVQRASLMSATLSAIRLRALRISPASFAAIQMLTTALDFNLTRIGAAAVGPGGIALPACDRRLLWRFGLSGERPIILVQAGASQGLGLLRSLAQALRLWSWGGIGCDVVVLNGEPASYQMPLQSGLASLVERHAADNAALPGGGTTSLHLLRLEELRADERHTLERLARVRLNADGRPLALLVQDWVDAHEASFEDRHAVSRTPVTGVAGDAGAVPRPVGRFDAPSGTFGFDVGVTCRPVRPWVNVIANAGFGAIVSEAGGGCTWAVNSRLNQLTAWSNDAVADPPSEWLLLQDLRTMAVWSVTPSAWADGKARYRVAHGQGDTLITHTHGEAEVSASWCVDPLTRVKQLRLRVRNRGHRSLQWRAVFVAEWVLGAQRADRAGVDTTALRQRLPDAPALRPGGGATARAQRLLALFATQRDEVAGFGDGTAFVALAGHADETDDWTCDRRELFDARGGPVLPDHLGRSSGAGLDPCAALATRLSIEAGGEVERCFLLGWAESPAAARTLALRAVEVAPAQRLAAVRSHWDALLGAVEVQTPDPLFDALVNRWLLYQAVSCRLWGKAAFYQAGGATGFRDQLQDTLALAWSRPDLLRAQIQACAARQFPQGDVQHWWHAPTGVGVRTHFSDDLLWLPLACARYLHATGDATLLDETAPFLDGPAIADGAEDAYFTPQTATEGASVYEHAARTIDRSLRVGSHGLPLMGSGDWNDGMNRVGIGGRGESVWLGWFLCRVVADFAPIAEARGDAVRARAWQQAATGWQAALDGAGWDGDWYRRAFFDDGQPLGTHAGSEARIDLIAQAWSVLSGAGSPERQRLAMAAVEAKLIDTDAGLIRLLDPPFAQSRPSPGYIQAYPGGVRENGGQYSHGAIWALMAQAALAQAAGAPVSAAAAEAVWNSFTMLSPAHRATHVTRGPVYGLEPYVMAGDICGQPPLAGRGGWSWYTGAAAWMHRAAVESIFGLDQGARALTLHPCLPPHWPQATLTLRRDARTLRFVFVRGAAAAGQALQRWPGAQPLAIGTALDWSAVVGAQVYVVALPPAA